MTVRGKRVVITGATGGLGPSLVEAFLAMQAEVVAVARRRTGLEELRARLQHHDRLDVAECDVSDPEGVEALFDSLGRRAPVDAVVHAAGAFVYGPLAERTDDDVARLVSGNVTATTLVIRAAVRRMATRGEGRVIAVGTDGAPSPNMALYGATKAAVAHLVEATAREVHGQGVRVNALLPGIMDTPGNREAMPDADRSGWAAPEAVARAAVWLASSDADGVSGALVRIPGG